MSALIEKKEPTSEYIRVMDPYEEFRLKIYSELILSQLATLGRVDLDACLHIANQAVKKFKKNDV